MKRKLAWLLTGLLMISLAGCGQENPQPQTQGLELQTESTESTELESGADDSQGAADSGTEPSETVEEPSLKSLFAEHGMKVGTCLTPQMTTSLTKSKIVLGQFNSVTMENAMKPDSILNKYASEEKGDLVVKFNQDMTKILQWAKKNDIAVRGHTIVWHSQTPNWIFYEDFDTGKALVSREVMLARLESFTRQIFEGLTEGGYADLFYAYDVANECWMEDGSMRESLWRETIGDDYLWYAFYYARKYAPDNIDLYYNDYNEQFKPDALVEFVKTLVDENGKSMIDGIGLQAHLYTMDDLDLYFEAIDKLSATGLKLELTELDVSLGAYQNTLPATEENLKIQGRFYYDLINGLFARVDAGTLKMDALTFWGFSDGASWRSDASPLLYDANYKLKYAYYGAMQMKELAGFD